MSKITVELEAFYGYSCGFQGHGSYQRALKYLNFVRNTDAHGQWYEDRNATDYLTEDQRNVQKILNFAALYIFTYAKYAMN